MTDKVFKGTIIGVYEKDWTNNDGEDMVFHSFKLDSEKRFFRTGTTKCSEIKKGAYVEFVADTKKNNQVDLKSIEVKEAPAEAPKRQSSGSGAVQKGSSSKENWDARAKYWSDKEVRDLEVIEPRITLMAGYNIAAQIVAAAARSDALSFGNTTQGKKLAMMTEWVHEIAVEVAQRGMQAGEILLESKNDDSGDE